MGVLGHETILLRGDGASSESFTEVADIISLQPPQMSRDSVETTVHNTTDRYRTYIPGLRDGGTVPLVVQYDPANTSHGDLLSDYNDDVLHNYKVQFPDDIGETWTFSGFLTQLGEETPIGDRIQRTMEFKVSGKPTLAATP